MAQSTVTANWTPSVTPGVTTQTLTFTVAGVAQPPIVFSDNTTSTASIVADDGVEVDADHFCTSPQGDSAHISASFTVPTVPPGPPAAATNLTLSSVPIP